MSLRGTGGKIKTVHFVLCFRIAVDLVYAFQQPGWTSEFSPVSYNALQEKLVT